MSNADTLARIAIERKIFAATCDALLDAGYYLGLNDGEETVVTACASVPDLVAASMSSADGKRQYIGWVRFIYGNGNGGFDVISDYTINLESAIGPTMKWIDKIEAEASA